SPAERARPAVGGVLPGPAAQREYPAAPVRLEADDDKRRVLDLYRHTHRADLQEMAGGVDLEALAQAREYALVAHLFSLVEPASVAIDPEPRQLPRRGVARGHQENTAAQKLTAPWGSGA